MKKLIIFDLDGTLLNTIADLATSVNFALTKNNFPQHDIADYNLFIGNGINKLLERALPRNSRNDETIRNIKKEFFLHYNNHNTDLTTPYEGIHFILQELQTKGIKLAVASNKYHEGTVRLTRHYFPDIDFVAVLGQRENIPIKPNPAIVNEILSISGIKADSALYAGDSGVDMETAKNSGVTSIGVTWGFRPREELDKFSPDYIIYYPFEILRIAE